MKHLALVLALFCSACSTSGTGIYINGQELTASDKAELDALLGESVPEGRYAIDAHGNLGYEGQAPIVNVGDLVRARRQQPQNKPFEMHSDDSHIVSEGGCTILSTPSGSLSSGC